MVKSRQLAIDEIRVAIALPVHWQSVGFLIFGGVAFGVLFLSLASYSRTEEDGAAARPSLGNLRYAHTIWSLQLKPDCVII